MEIRVYYEDTDSGGVVFYANYLRFMERGRTEFFRERGISVAEYDRNGFLFVVAHADVSYRAPARHDDLLDVRSEIIEYSKASFTFSQRIFRKADEKLMVDAKLKLVCTDSNGKPRGLPKEVRGILEREVVQMQEEGKAE
ncbi:MAG: YbgC/FadM family acyl-CoA thioesterase [Planctomycetota bacterium]|jgi:acyl-CoA thioester hydrolase